MRQTLSTKKIGYENGQTKKPNYFFSFNLKKLAYIKFKD